MKVNLIVPFLCVLLTAISSCSPRQDKGTYALVSNWPQLSPGYQLSQPTGIGIDTSEHIFVFHRTGRRWTKPFPDSLISVNTILELENESGKILNGWGANQFIMPHGLTVDKNNNVWVTDVALHQVFKFTHEGKLLMTLGVSKTAGNDSLHFNLPTDVAIADDGSFYVSDGYGNSRVVKFSADGKYLFEWGTHGNKAGEFDIPHGITLDQQGNVYVADRQNNRVQVFDSKGKYLKEWKNNDPVEQLPSVAFDKSTQRLFAIDYDASKNPDSVIRGSTFFQYDAAGQVLFHFGSMETNGRTGSWYHDLAIDKYGSVYVGDILGKRVQKFELKTN